MVPSTVASTVAAAPTMRLLRTAVSTGSLCRSLRYQSKVKPSQDAVSRPWLKEKATSTRRGA